jgi:hypothetical protein
MTNLHSFTSAWLLCLTPPTALNALAFRRCLGRPECGPDYPSAGGHP